MNQLMQKNNTNGLSRRPLTQIIPLLYSTLPRCSILLAAKATKPVVVWCVPHENVLNKLAPDEIDIVSNTCYLGCNLDRYS